MAYYKFYQDKKCTVWERIFFTVEADSEEAAIRCAGQLGKGDLYAAEMQEEGIAIDESETLYDSMEELPVDDNGDQPTVEIFVGTPRKGRMIAQNVSGPQWRRWWWQTDFATMEHITGLRQSDYDSEGGYQAFIDACEVWWSGQSEEEQIRLWKEYDA